MAIWQLEIPPGVPAQKFTVKLYPNGRIASPDSDRTWSIEDGKLVMLLPDNNAPNGMWRNAVQISEDGKSCTGSNNRGTKIVGKRIFPD